MLDYKSLPIGDDAPAVINAVVEIPKGSTNKYEYDPRLGVFRLDRVLHSAVYYPADYGFIPSTLAEDGDPLDLLIFLSGPTFPGCCSRLDRSGSSIWLTTRVLMKKFWPLLSMIRATKGSTILKI
jgi:inorganic pyrophosphatase